MVVSPLALVGFIAIDVRMARDSFVPAQYAPEADNKVNKWIKPLRVLRAARLNGRSLDDVAEKWLQLYRQGELPDLPSQGTWDTFAAGSKAEILGARRYLCTYVLEGGLSALRHGHYEEAAERFVLTTELNEILKRSDLDTLGLSLIQQTNAMTRLAKVATLCPTVISPELRSRIATVAQQSLFGSGIAQLTKRQYTPIVEESDIPMPSYEQVLLAGFGHMASDDYDRAFSTEAKGIAQTVRLCLHHDDNFQQAVSWVLGDELY